MYCGYDCPFCYGTGYEGEHCQILEEMYGSKLQHYKVVDIVNGKRYLYPRTMWLSEVDGRSINESGELTGDICRFNISKYIECYYGVICRD